MASFVLNKESVKQGLHMKRFLPQNSVAQSGQMFGSTTSQKANLFLRVQRFAAISAALAGLVLSTNAFAQTPTDSKGKQKTPPVRGGMNGGGGPKNPVRGGTNGGGGDIIHDFAINPSDVERIINKNFPQNFIMMFNHLEARQLGSYEYSITELKNPKLDANLRPYHLTVVESYRKLFKSGSTVQELIPSIKFDLRDKCLAPKREGDESSGLEEKPASTYKMPLNSICVSPNFISRDAKITQGNAEEILLPLFGHEISHLKGTNEDQANSIQQQFKSFKIKPNEDLIKKHIRSLKETLLWTRQTIFAIENNFEAAPMMLLAQGFKNDFGDLATGADSGQIKFYDIGLSPLSLTNSKVLSSLSMKYFVPLVTSPLNSKFAKEMEKMNELREARPSSERSTKLTVQFMNQIFQDKAEISVVEMMIRMGLLDKTQYTEVRDGKEFSRPMTEPELRLWYSSTFESSVMVRKYSNLQGIVSEIKEIQQYLLQALAADQALQGLAPKSSFLLKNYTPVFLNSSVEATQRDNLIKIEATHKAISLKEEAFAEKVRPDLRKARAHLRSLESDIKTKLAVLTTMENEFTKYIPENAREIKRLKLEVAELQKAKVDSLARIENLKIKATAAKGEILRLKQELKNLVEQK